MVHSKDLENVYDKGVGEHYLFGYFNNAILIGQNKK